MDFEAPSQALPRPESWKAAHGPKVVNTSATKPSRSNEPWTQEELDVLKRYFANRTNFDLYFGTEHGGRTPILIHLADLLKSRTQDSIRSKISFIKNDLTAQHNRMGVVDLDKALEQSIQTVKDIEESKQAYVRTYQIGTEESAIWVLQAEHCQKKIAEFDRQVEFEARMRAELQDIQGRQQTLRQVRNGERPIEDLREWWDEATMAKEDVDEFKATFGLTGAAEHEGEYSYHGH